MTITEKILAAHSEKKKILPGEFIQTRVDIALGNDITAPLAIEEFRKMGIPLVFDKGKIVLIPDHFTPNKDIKSAHQCKLLREFAREQNISHYYEVGRCGIEHVFLPENGIVLPGDVVIGADSHTCTYGALGAFATGVGSTDLAAVMATGNIWLKVPETIKFVLKGELKKWVCGKDIILYIIGDIGVEGARYCAMEFTGESIEKFSMSDRFTICNMAIEAGAKSAIFETNEKVREYIEPKAERPYDIYTSDKDAKYLKTIEYDLSKIEPQVAFPHLPSNTKPISKVGEVKIDQVVIGSCTNGSLDDLKIAAEILKGKKIHPSVRVIIIPATQKIYLEAVREGLVEIFVSSGCVVSTPTCGPCLGGHMGVLAEGERAVATTNRNFVGRMGHIGSEVYLSSPAIAASSAVLGRIAHPEEIK